MKTRIFKRGLPFLAFFVAIFGAFAFQTGTDNAKMADHIGGIPVPMDCEATSKLCTDEVRTVKCSFSGQQLYKINGSVCGAELWERN